MEGEDAETTTRYVCSACGYSRRDVESVVEHIASSHERDARVKEYEEQQPQSYVGRFLRRIDEWLP